MGAENVNLLTEKEARTKWCPLDKGSYSDRHIGGTNPHCIGSACMAWHWANTCGDEVVERAERPVGEADDLPQRPGFLWNAGTKIDGIVHWRLRPQLGNCGAFGKVRS